MTPEPPTTTVTTTNATAGVANGNALAAIGHATFGRPMGIDVTVVRDLPALRSLETEWRALAGCGPSTLFRGPDWLIPWWHAYHNALNAELHVIVGRASEADGDVAAGEIVCLAPLYRLSLIHI